jgi:hypothetical protein
MKKYRGKKGIPLVAVIITIIILLILAGITISTIGEKNKLAEQAKLAKSNTKTPTSSSVADSSTTFSTAYGTIDIVWLSGTTNTVASAPNSPILTANNESMTPVVFNETTNAWDDTTASDNNWYDYSSKKWANAMTEDDSYFVWIPRYAYRITYYESNTSTTPTGYYDGWGMWNASNGTVKYALDSGIETVDYNGNKYIVHPAFETNLDNGGWSSELSGFWFAKFEMGKSSAGLNLTSSPGAIGGFLSQNIGELYTMGRQATYGYTGVKDTDGNTSFMYSHMSKNSEWGAVAYLTQSKFGRNGVKVSNNNVLLNTSLAYNWNTGCGYLNNDEAESTTGNVYGIYDMTCGGWELMSCFNSVDDGAGRTDFIRDMVGQQQRV